MPFREPLCPQVEIIGPLRWECKTTALTDMLPQQMNLDELAGALPCE